MFTDKLGISWALFTLVFLLGSVLGGTAVFAQSAFYVTSFSDGTVDAISAAGVVTPFASGFVHPSGLAMDADGNIYVATEDANYDIFKISPTGTVVLFAAINQQTSGLAIDASGNLYVSAPYGQEILKLTPDGTSHLFYNSTFVPDEVFKPLGLAFDATGNLLVADNDGGSSSSPSIVKISPSGVGQPVVSNILDSFDVAVGSGDNLYDSSLNPVSDGNQTGRPLPTDPIYQISPDDTASIYAKGFLEPTGLTLDGVGNLYVCDADNNDIVEIGSSGNQSIFVQSINTPDYIISVPEPSSAAAMGILFILFASPRTPWRLRGGAA